MLLLQHSLLNFIVGEFLETGGQAEVETDLDQPFGWVVLPPLDSVSVIGGIAVMVVVVSFTKSDECGEDVVSWGMSVIERLIAEPVGKRVDAERSVVDKDKSADTGIVKSTSPVTPTETSDDSGNKEAHDEDDDSVVLVLHADEDIRVEIGDICTSDSFGVLFEDHPTEMRVHQAFSDRVWIFLCVCITMMSAMVSRPPSNRSFNGTATKSSENVLERSRCGV